jgi:N-6 DNA Methylase
MTFTPKQRADFKAAVDALQATVKGKEATMYTSLRDLFVDILGYAKTSVVVDTAGTRGRPDLTVYAPGGAAGTRVSWIVGEAKDEHDAVANPANRVSLFAEKAKYITADTAYFVMADPGMLVIRGVGLGSLADVELPWDGLTIEGFAAGLAPLRADRAGVPEMLREFREGNEALIARDKLTATPGTDAAALVAIQINRNVFFDTLTETTHLLQQATLRALESVRAGRDEILSRIEEFSAKYGGYVFRAYPISIEGKERVGREKEQAHRKESALLRRFLVQQPALSRLTLDALPRFAERTGLDPKKEPDKLERFFANETANLILARILLIRFLEDHGFFDEEGPDGTQRRRYLCNGGVAAFQGMHDYFGHGYTRLLEEAYRTGGHFYSAAFDETELDWIIALSVPELSRTLEWAMFRFARFDFATARGDLMSGVYDRFLDRKQRKEQGEVYTPPSIARYILDRLALPETAEVLDPACGSGTFLIERYRQTYGEIADSGTGTYTDARIAVERLAGNDLNPFSAVLTQIQLLWHLLAFGDEIRSHGFPDLRVTERANSLVPGSLYDPTQTRFGEIDRSGYDAVIGNPPYVRAERAGELEAHARAYFTNPRTVGAKAFPGVSIGSNAYTLFIYRALDYWCRQPGNGGSAGKLGFVVPLAFCVSNEATDLRKLFLPDGRWSIREIVDLELIWSEIFDADVLPMLLIAEATPAKANDEVIIRLADESCVEYHAGAKRPTFRFDHLPEQKLTYADLFAPDGRIMTRLTPQRAKILKKLRGNATLRDAAMSYWTKRGEKAVLKAPSGVGAAKWREERLIRDGLAKRGELHYLSKGGHTVFKGENITAARFSGDPVHIRFDVSKASSPSVWAYQDLLPATMYAIPVLEQVPVAAPFDPRKVAVENTVIVFGPRKDLAAVPFDAVLLSTIYSYFHVIGARRSYQNKIRGHIYSSAVADLPWNDEIAKHASQLEAIRTDLLKACERRYEQTTKLAAEAAALGLQPLKEVVRHRAGAKILKSEAFADEPQVTLEVGHILEADAGWTLPLDAEGGHDILFNDGELAQLAQAGLALAQGTELSWNDILNTPIPISVPMAEALAKLHAEYAPERLDEVIESEIAKLDAIVGPALGLSPADVAEIRRDMVEDPFLARVRPRYPFFRPRQYGRRLNLERRDRYAA